MLFLNFTILSKYIIIFWLKSPVAFQDTFWSLYINSWVVMSSWITLFTFEVMLGEESYHVKMCSGLPPSVSQSNVALTEKKSFNNLLRTLTVLIHLVIWARIQIYKHKTEGQISIVGLSNNKKSWLKNLERHTFSDMITNITSVFCLILIGVIQLQLKVDSLADFNNYPYYLFEYFYSMIKAPIMFNLLLIVILVRNRQLRKVLFRDLKMEILNLIS